MRRKVNTIIMHAFYVIVSSILSAFVIANDDLNYKQSKSFNIFRRNSTSTSNLREKLDEKSRMPFVFCGSVVPLPKTKFCDGHRDCADGSDETANLCKNNRCSEKEFRCDYGACISTKLICDGVFHCADGSDEGPTVCADGKCMVPWTTANTAYYVLGCNHCAEGAEVKEGTALRYQCLNYFIPKPIRVVCENSAWIPFLPKCEDNTDLPENRPLSISFWNTDKSKRINATESAKVGQISKFISNKSDSPLAQPIITNTIYPNYNQTYHGSDFPTFNASNARYPIPPLISFIITNTGVLVNNSSKNISVKKIPQGIFFLDENPAASALYVGSSEVNAISTFKPKFSVSNPSDQQNFEYLSNSMNNSTDA